MLAATIIMQVSLTERETSILQLLCAGKTKKEVAKEIHLSQWTVAFHVNEMLFRFGCTNTVALCAYAIRNNLIQ